MENKIERPEGQFAKKFKVVMDVESMPNRLDVATFSKLADSGFIFYDSSKGHRPKLYIIDGDVDPKTIPAFVDVKGEELNIEDLEKKWEDEEFWRKELYRCKQSPLYYYTNYVSINPKPTQEEITKYLETVGMGATEDSGEIGDSVISDRVREARDKFAKGVTLENLKSLKPVRDRIDEEYNTQTEELKAEVSEKYGLSGKVEKAIKDKVVSTILKIKVKDAPEELKYFVIENKGVWDKALIKATELDVLLRLWKKL